MIRIPIRNRPFETEEARRLESMGLIGALVRHKKTGEISLLRWSGRDFFEDIGFVAKGMWITVFSESEIEVLELPVHSDDEYCYYPDDES